MRPFNHRQALENAAFLDALRRTGNAAAFGDGVEQGVAHRRAITDSE